MSTYEVTPVEGGKVIKSWTKGVPFEDAAREQLKNVAKLPFIHHHVAAMPDVHAGIGATVGSVIATLGAIVPAAVGVDIGCGMQAVPTNLKSHDLGNLVVLRAMIEVAVPHGRSANGSKDDVGSWRGSAPECVRDAWRPLFERHCDVLSKHPLLAHSHACDQLGTLGTGNHFIEVCLDEGDRVWVVLHSGSRGPGNKIGTYFIAKAKEEMERWHIRLPDPNLAYLPSDTLLHDEYVTAVLWAQSYAFENRCLMMGRVIEALVAHVDHVVAATDGAAIDCHHNYVAKENHFGKNVFVTRKGAVRARKGDLGIIPGSMGARSYIVCGLGNEESFHSCSHGAGRAMSRTEAKKRFSVAGHEKATAGIECRKDADVVDETPGAYKDIDAVMEAQRDLVEVVHTLRQVIVVKG